MYIRTTLKLVVKYKDSTCVKVQSKRRKDPKEIIARFDEMKKTMDAYFVVDDLHHLQRGGRLNSAQAFIGSLLQVKPVLYFRDKIIIPFEKIRTRKKR